MKRFIFVFGFLAFGITLFIFILSKVGWQEIWQNLIILSLPRFLFILGIALAGFLFHVFRWQIILKSQSVKKISFKKLVQARAIGFALCYLTPSAYFGGEPLWAIFLAEETNLDWNKNIFSIIIDKALELTTNALFILFGIIYLLIFFDLPSWLDYFLIFFIFFCIGISYFFYSRAFRKKGFFSTIIDMFWLKNFKHVKGMVGDIKEIEGHISNFFKKQPRYFIESIIFSIFGRFFIILSIWLIISSLGIQLNLFQVLGVIALSAAIYFVPIPGSLGAHETAQFAIFSVLGLAGSVGIAFSLILRMVHLIGTGIGLLMLLHFQIKRWGRTIIKSLDKFGQKIKNSLNNSDK